MRWDEWPDDPAADDRAGADYPEPYGPQFVAPSDLVGWILNNEGLAEMSTIDRVIGRFVDRVDAACEWAAARLRRS